jgi:chaperone BCS1
LDDALIRPGRVDVKMALTHADKRQIESLFLNFYPEASVALANEFAIEIAPAKLSMAHIQGHFLMNKNNPKAAIESAKEMVRTSKTSL